MAMESCIPRSTLLAFRVKWLEKKFWSTFPFNLPGEPFPFLSGRPGKWPSLCPSSENECRLRRFSQLRSPKILMSAIRTKKMTRTKMMGNHKISPSFPPPGPFHTLWEEPLSGAVKFSQTKRWDGIYFAMRNHKKKRPPKDHFDHFLGTCHFAEKPSSHVRKSTTSFPNYLISIIFFWRWIFFSGLKVDIFTVWATNSYICVPLKAGNVTKKMPKGHTGSAVDWVLKAPYAGCMKWKKPKTFFIFENILQMKILQMKNVLGIWH